MTDKSGLWKLLEMPPIMGMCKVCNEEREEDLVAHGPGVGVLMFFPCHHVVHSTKQRSVWYHSEDKDNILLEEIK